MTPTATKHQRMRAALWRWRWVALAALLALCFQQVLTILTQLTPATHYVVTAHDNLPAGIQLTASQLELAPVHDDLVNTSSNPQDFVGQHLLVPISRGSVISKNELLSPETVTQARPGYVIASVSLADNGGLSLVRTGSYLDLFAPVPPTTTNSTTEATLLAQHIRVAGVITSPGNQSFLRDTPDTKQYFLEIPQSAVKVVLGVGLQTPLLAVLSSQETIP